MDTTVASSAGPSRPRLPITPRSPRFAFDAVPRHWFGGNGVATHVANGVNLLFPAGERFFVRSVHHFLRELHDPVLLAQARGFAGQEGRHARAHEDFFRVLEAQGFRLERFLRVYEAIAYGTIERFAPRALSLATTAACEHFTAMLATSALRDELLLHADPAVRDLLLWHAAEEIEHRAVAFDVLASVRPGYALRMAGLALGTACLGGFWVAATLTLLMQDGELNLAKVGEQRRQIRAVRPDGGPAKLMLNGIRAYVRRDFHPLDARDLDELARDYLSRAGLAAT